MFERASSRLVVASLVLASAALVVSRADATSGAITLTSSSATVAPGSQVTLSAGMPVSVAGTVSQEIVQTIDPTKVKLTSIADITYPAGWTLSYCSGAATDCTVSANFSATTPANAAAWALVKAVKASGNIVSEGPSQSGKQIASRTTSGVLASSGGAVAASGSGDGFDVFFDPGYTRVFNRIHHQYSLFVDCNWLRTENGHTAGANCWSASGGAWPVEANGMLKIAGAMNSDRSTGWIDSNNRLWAETAKTGTDFGYGFYCIDVSGVAPQPCAGGSWYRLLTPATEPTNYDEVMDLAVVDGKLFTLVVKIGSAGATYGKYVLCLDTRAAGGPAPCPGQPYSMNDVNFIRGKPDEGETASNITAISGKVYAVGTSTIAPNKQRLWCVDPTKIVAGATSSSIGCTGWATNPVVADQGGPLITAPNSSGVPVGVCTAFSSATCFSLADGTTTVTGIPSNLVARLASYDLGALAVRGWASGVATSKTRVYWPWQGNIACFDAAVNSMCSGGSWSNFGMVSEQAVYAIRIDPVNPRCFWTNADTGSIKVWTDTGTQGCTAVSPVVTFSADVAIPRMACTANSGIQEWVDFRIAGVGSVDRKWSSASLRVLDPSGIAVPGWEDKPVPDNGVLSLSGLPVSGGSGGSAWVAGDLDFRVTFQEPTYAAAPQATIKAIGDAPQLCVRATALALCPGGSGPLSGLAGSSVSVSAVGSATNASNVTTSLSPVSQSVAMSAPTNAQCGATLSGRAGDATLGSAGTAISGVTVSLLDSSGNPVLVNGSPVTATTAADGTYSFGYLFPGSYKVGFPTSGTKSVSSATVVSGAAGTSAGTANAAAGVATSNVASVAVGTNAVVNGLYSLPLSVANDVSSGGQGVAQTKNVLSNDTAGSGRTLTASAVKLCAANEVSPNCSFGSASAGVVVAGQGKYTVNASGEVTFTPCNGVNTPVMVPVCSGVFTGQATGLSYQVTDGSSTTSATYTPTVVPSPSASPDTGSGAFDTNQVFTPFANDTPGTVGATPYPFDVASVKICSVSTADGACTGTANVVEANQGTWSVNAATGVVTFDPLPSFTGPATAIKYCVADSVGQRVCSTITPTVQPPGPSVAGADTSAGVVDAVQTKNLLANDTVVSGVTLSAGSARLCGSGQTAPNCSASTLDVANVGSYSITNGTVTFTPCTAAVTANCTTGTSFTGAAPAVGYQVTDSQNRTVSSTYVANVAPPPTLVPDSSSGAIGVTQSAVLLVNDQPSTGTTMLSASLRLCDPRTNPAQTPNNCTVGVGSSIDIVDVGTYTVSANGVVSFTPCGTDVTANCTSGVAFVGVATPVTYQATDSLGQYGSSTYTPTVTPPTPPMFFVPSPTGPRAEPQDRAVSPGQTITFTPVLGDNGLATGDGLRSDLMAGPCLVDPASQQCGTRVQIPGEGIWTIDRTSGVVTFAADADVALGRLTPVQYRVTDRSGQTSSAALTPVVAPPGTPVDDPMSGDIDRDQRFRPIDNDTPTDEARWNPSTLRLCGAGEQSPGCDRMTLDVPGEGTYTVHLDGTIVFDPLPWFTGSATPIRYQISDSLGRTYSARLLAQVAGRGQSRHPRLPITGSDQTPTVLLVALFFVTAGSLVVGAQRRRVTSRR